jgi:hypothetical protein
MWYAADIGYSFTNLLGNVVGVVIKVLIFLAILALGWLLAGWIRRALQAVLRRSGFDRLAQRGGLNRLLARDSASEVTARLVMYAFLLVVLQIAFGVFGPNLVSDLLARVIAWLPRLFVAVAIIVVAAAVAGWVKDMISGALGGLSYGRGIATAAQALILVLATFAALTQIGVASSVITPVLWALLFAVTGVLVVGLGGGLIKPMQHRWERMLNRAETETTIAAERVRSNRAAQAAAQGEYGERDRNVPGGFEQPAYGGAMATDERPPTTLRPGEYAEGYPEYTERSDYDR